MSQVPVRVGLGFVVCLAVQFVAASPAAADPSTNHCCWDRWGVESGADVIEANAVLGWNEYSVAWEVSAGPIIGTSTSITLPNGLSDFWMDCPAYASWDAGTHTLTFTPLAPLGDGWSADYGIDKIKSMTQQTPRLKAARSISNPVFASDLETRTVSVTLDIAAGALASDKDLDVRLAQGWDLPPGISVTGVANVSCPAGFGWGGGTEPDFYTYNAGGLGSLSGQYTFSADITFQRSGSMSQAAMGDLFFKCPAMVQYSQLEFDPTTTGTSASMTLAPGVQVGFEAGQTVSFSPHAHKVAQELGFESVAAANGAPASVVGIILAKGRRQTVTGQTVYSFFVDCNSVNVVSATVTTPGAVTYHLIPDNNDGSDWGWDFEAQSDVAADLDGFGDGDYTIKLTGADGNQNTYVVPLSGAFPADTPDYDLACWSQTSDRRPTISWDAPLDGNVNMVHRGLWAGDKDYVEDITDCSQTSLTPWEDLPCGFAMANAAFLDAETGTFADGATYLSGYYSGADVGFNVTPEPGSAVLLACGSVALSLRRRRRA